LGIPDTRQKLSPPTRTSGLPDGIFLNQIRVNFRGSGILEGLEMDYVGIVCGHLVYFAAIWYVLWSLGMFFPVLVCCNKENLATLTYIRIF
jgi:hypothetical protein